MASLADLLEDYRNWRGRQEWSIGKDKDVLAGEDPSLVDFVDKFGGIGTDAGGLVGMIKASHGSPHAFTKFLMSKLGTGEGAQAYGHGMYFGEGFDSPTAIEYQKRLSDKGAQGIAAKFLQNWGSEESAIENLSKMIERKRPDFSQEYLTPYEDALTLLQSKAPLTGEGSLYNVELKWPDAAREAVDPLSHEHLLDWDKPLSEQSEYVQSKLSVLPEIEDLIKKKYETRKGLFEKFPPKHPMREVLKSRLSNEYSPSGESIYGALSKRGAPSPASWQNSSAFLKELGIPGSKYLDAGSRLNQAGTSNYVIFDENIPNIVSRNGVSLTDLLRR